jgi:predicted Zn-dependent protease
MNVNTYEKLIQIKNNIEKYLEKINVDNYNCIISISQNTNIKTINFNYESFVENEEIIVNFQIFKDKKQYIFSVTGIDNLENIIMEIPNVMANMEVSEFYDNTPIFHEKVSVKKCLYTVPMTIPNEIVDNFFKEIQLINKTENRNIYDSINIDNNKSYKLFFNKGKYEYFKHTESSSYYICLTEDNGNNKYTDYEYETFFTPINEKEIINKITDRLKKIQIKTNLDIGKYDVIFNTSFSYKLVNMVVKALYGDLIWRKKSFLVDKIGTKIFGDNINIIENPHIENSLSNSPVDMEANLIIKKHLVEKGEIKTMLLNKEYGEKFKLPPTSNSWGFAIGYTNIYLEPGTYKNLINETSNCIVLNSIIGAGFQIHNGEISVSIDGFYYKDKEFKGSVSGTINGHIIDLLSNCLLGDDMDYDKYIAPSILVKNMTFAPVNEE